MSQGRERHPGTAMARRGCRARKVGRDAEQNTRKRPNKPLADKRTPEI